jgi:hypothetical protein
MSETPRRWDAWTLPTFMLWLTLLLAGLFPELAFYTLRELGGVTTQRALANSPWLLTIALAGYTTWFAHGAAREAGASEIVARGSAVQVAILALAAFLCVPGQWTGLSEAGMIILLLRAPAIPDSFIRTMAYVGGGIKLIAWLNLFVLLLRYYALGERTVFATLFSIFPSVHRAQSEDAQRVVAGPAEAGLSGPNGDD